MLNASRINANLIKKLLKDLRKKIHMIGRLVPNMLVIRIVTI